MRQWREWSKLDRTQSAARAAHLFMNMIACSACGLPWPEGYVHDGCPGPAVPARPDRGVIGPTRDMSVPVSGSIFLAWKHQ